MDPINFNFLCNNVKSFQTSIELIQNKTFSKVIIILQETHSRKENKIKRKDKFDGDLYCSHGKSNSCGVLTGFSGNKTFTVKKRLCGKNGKILILETLTDD